MCKFRPVVHNSNGTRSLRSVTTTTTSSTTTRLLLLVLLVSPARGDDKSLKVWRLSPLLIRVQGYMIAFLENGMFFPARRISWKCLLVVTDFIFGWWLVNPVFQFSLSSWFFTASCLSGSAVTSSKITILNCWERMTRASCLFQVGAWWISKLSVAVHTMSPYWAAIY